MSPEKLKIYCVASGNVDKVKEKNGGYELKSWRIDLVCKNKEDERDYKGK